MTDLLRLPGWVTTSIDETDERMIIHATYTKQPDVCQACGELMTRDADRISDSVTKLEAVTTSKLSIAVQAALIEKIQRLERDLEILKERVSRAESNSVEHVLKPLRRRETVLLYFGNEPADVYEETLQQNYPEETVKHVMQEVFFLNGSELNSTEKTALRLSLRQRWLPTLKQDA